MTHHIHRPWRVQAWTLHVLPVLATRKLHLACRAPLQGTQYVLQRQVQGTFQYDCCPHRHSGYAPRMGYSNSILPQNGPAHCLQVACRSTQHDLWADAPCWGRAIT